MIAIRVMAEVGAAAITVAAAAVDEMVAVVTVEVAMAMAVTAMASTRTGAALREYREEISATDQWDGPLLKSQLRGAWSTHNLSLITCRAVR
jgi:hypothetical protein